MKRGYQFLALLLSFVMLLGLLPAVAAETEYQTIDAFIAESAPTINGTVSEDIWFVDHSLSALSAEGAPAAEAGFLWDETNVYIALRHDGAETVTVSVGQGTAVYDVAEGSFTTNTLSATAAAANTVVEMAIPFAAMGVTLTAFDQVLPIAISVTDSDGTASLPENSALCLRGEAMFVADGCGDMNAIGYVDGQQYSNGSNSYSEVTITQEPGAYHFYAPAKTIVTNGIRLNKTISGNDPMNIEFDVTLDKLSVYDANRGWRGFVLDLRTTNGYTRRCSLNQDTDGTVYFNLLVNSDKGDEVRVPTKLKEGDRAVIRMEVQEDQTTKLYINGEHIYDFSAFVNVASGFRNFVEWSINQYNWVSDETDVTLHSYHITRPVYADDAAVAASMLDELTFDDIKGGNTDPAMILADLSLPEALEVPVLGSNAPLTWESSNPNVIANDGTFVSEGEGGEVILTATLTYNGQTYTKEFVLNVPAFDPYANAMYLENDRDPYTGVLGSKGMSLEVTLDQKLASVGYDLGAVITINQIFLTDTDTLSRIHKDNLSLYVSDDNVTYRRVKDWTLFRCGTDLILANFEEECRYVKVHCTLEDTDGAAFTNNLQYMIWPQNSNELVGGNGGEFTLLRKVQVSAEEGYTDAIAQIKQDSEYDLRFVCDGRLLQHYFDGETWFVRVPEIEDTAIVEIWGGNEIAADLSNLEGVFEAAYGNRIVQDMTDPYYYGNIKARQMPNGDLIVIFNRPTSPCDLMYRRSTDGGRTWTDAEVLTDTLDYGRNEGGCYLVDGDRVWFCYFFYTRFNSSNMANSDCKIALIYTDDSGYTWSEPYYVDTGHTYSLTYSNGLKLSGADGEGENVDYVFPYHFQSSNSGSFNISAFYSKDGGETWISSESCIDYEGPSGFEGGPTEAAIAELSDGTIQMLMRCQYSSVYWLATTTSEDHGVTWNEQAVKTNISAPNTMPVLERADVDSDGDKDYVLEWGGNNLLGASSYKRYPLTLAWSDDEMQTWKQKLSLYAGTTYAAYTGRTNSTTQPDITWSNYMGGDDAYVCWSDWSNSMDTMGSILIEDFTDYLYKSKGAGDTFETTSLRHENWLPVTGEAVISNEQAKDSNYSLKISDVSSGIGRADRTVPAMFDGEVAMDLKLEKLNTGNFLSIELKSAFADGHYSGTLAMALIYPDGTVKDRDITVTPGSHDTVLGTVNASEWNRFSIRFDAKAGTAELYVNGEKLGNLTMDLSRGDSVTNIQVSDASSTKNQMVAYIDNFTATTGELLTVSEVPAESELFDLYGANMKLSSDLTMNFFVAASNITGEGWYAEIVRDENTTKINLADCETSDGYYKLVYPGFAAKEMTDEVVVTIYDADGNAVSNPWTDSIRDYAMRVFEKENKTLLVDMLNYGAAAQENFSYKTDDLANALLSDEQKTYGSQAVTLENKQVTGKNFYGASLSLKNVLSLNLYFVNVTEDMNAVITYTNHNGEDKRFEKAVTMNGNYGVVTLTELALADCRELVTCTIVDADGNEIASVTDSIESYCARTLDSQPLNEPLMKFCQSAWNTFHQ